MSDYTQELEEKLRSARKRVREGAEVSALKASAPTLFEIIDGEMSLAVNRAFSEKPLSHEEYLSAHGEVKGIRRIRNLIDAKEALQPQAAAEAEAIQNNLENLNG